MEASYHFPRPRRNAASLLEEALHGAEWTMTGHTGLPVRDGTRPISVVIQMRTLTPFPARCKIYTPPLATRAPAYASSIGRAMLGPAQCDAEVVALLGARAWKLRRQAMWPAHDRARTCWNGWPKCATNGSGPLSRGRVMSATVRGIFISAVIRLVGHGQI
jgi:hypothetical protein